MAERMETRPLQRLGYFTRASQPPARPTAKCSRDGGIGSDKGPDPPKLIRPASTRSNLSWRVIRFSWPFGFTRGLQHLFVSMGRFERVDVSRKAARSVPGVPIYCHAERYGEVRHMAAQHHHDKHHGHEAHGHARHDHAGKASERRLRAALVLLFAFMLVEAIGGFWANSIALLAEAAHMLADSGSLLLAIIAIRVGRRPASAARTYGHRRYQTLAAYTNGLVLLGLTIWFVVEAARRLLVPAEVNGKIMLGIAVIGGIANLAAFVVLSGASSLNEKGARAHVLSDLLGSGAAAAAAGIILAFGWSAADPLLSILISILILRSGWQLTRDSAHVLLEGTPKGLDLGAVETELKGISGLSSIHHVHAWSLTGESPIVTLHAELFEGADRQQVLTVVVSRLRERFGVEHATVQIEEGACVEPGTRDDCHGASGFD